MKKLKRMVAWVLSLAMVLTLIPTTAYADVYGPGKYSIEYLEDDGYVLSGVAKASSSDAVQVTAVATPSGYRVDKVRWNTTTMPGTKYDATEIGENLWEFTMPERNVQVYADTSVLLTLDPDYEVPTPRESLITMSIEGDSEKCWAASTWEYVDVTTTLSSLYGRVKGIRLDYEVGTAEYIDVPYINKDDTCTWRIYFSKYDKYGRKGLRPMTIEPVFEWFEGIKSGITYTLDDCSLVDGPSIADSLTEVNFTLEEDPGYHLSKTDIVVTTASSKVITVEEEADGSFSFLMPDEAVTITAKAKKNTATLKLGDGVTAYYVDSYGVKGDKVDTSKNVDGGTDLLIVAQKAGHKVDTIKVYDNGKEIEFLPEWNPESQQYHWMVPVTEDGHEYNIVAGFSSETATYPTATATWNTTHADAVKFIPGDSQTVKAKSRTEVKFAIATPSDYQIKGISITDANGNSYQYVKDSSGNYSFYMPNSNAVVDVEFEEKENPHPLYFKTDGAHAGSIEVFENGKKINSGDSVTPGSTIVAEVSCKNGFSSTFSVYYYESTDSSDPIKHFDFELYLKDGKQCMSFEVPEDYDDYGELVATIYEATEKHDIYVVDDFSPYEGTVTIIEPEKKDDRYQATCGDTVKVLVEPAENMELRSIYFTTDSGFQCDCTRYIGVDEFYFFKMPASNVQIHVEFGQELKPGEVDVVARYNSKYGAVSLMDTKASESSVIYFQVLPYSGYELSATPQWQVYYTDGSSDERQDATFCQGMDLYSYAFMAPADFEPEGKTVDRIEVYADFKSMDHGYYELKSKITAGDQDFEGASVKFNGEQMLTVKDGTKVTAVIVATNKAYHVSSVKLQTLNAEEVPYHIVSSNTQMWTIEFNMPDDDAVLYADFGCSTYDVKLSTTCGGEGEYSLSTNIAYWGETVTVYAKPTSDLISKEIKVVAKDGTEISYTPISMVNDNFIFTMPNQPVTVSLEYRKKINTVVFDKNADDAEGTMADQEFEYGVAKKLTKNAYTRAGYVFAGWSFMKETIWIPYADEEEVSWDFADGYKIKLHAQWVAKGDTPYKVEHWQEKLDGTYELVDTDQETGTTDAYTDAVAKSYAGFQVQAFENVPIAGDGTTVVTIKYLRDRITVAISQSEAEESKRGLESVTVSPEPVDTPILPRYRYNQPVTVTAKVKEGYTLKWVGQEAWGNETEINFNATSTVVAVAVASADTDTPYTVEYYTQNIDDDLYTLDSSVPCEGTTDTETAVVADPIPGYTAQEIEQQIITGDGKAVVKVYYDRNKYTVTASAGTGIASVTPEEESYKHLAYATVKATVKPGYTWVKWTDGTTDYTKQNYKFQVNAQDYSLTAVAKANTNTKYTVKTYVQNVEDDAYTLENSVVKTGTTDTMTEEVALEKKGFTAKEIEQQIITGDGEAVVEIYYDRNVYVVAAFKGNGIASVEPEEPKAYKYGATARISATEKPGYTFDQWTGEGAGWKAINKAFTVDAQNYFVTAVATADTDTAYTVEYYTQNVDNDEYSLDYSDPCTGTTDTRTNVKADPIPGFKAKEIEQQIITGDGKAIVRVYYDRLSYKVTTVAGTGITEVTEGGTFRYLKKIALEAKVAPGYTFAKWSDGDTNAVREYEVNESKTLIATATPNEDTVYFIRYYVQCVNGKYNLENTDHATGETGTMTHVVPTIRQGFKAQEVTQKIIAGDESTYVDVYYDRIAYDVILGFDEESILSVEGDGSFVYGSWAEAEATLKTGYKFTGWYNEDDELVSTENPYEFSIQFDDVTLTAKGEPVNYKVRFNANGGGGTMADQAFVFGTAQKLTKNAFSRGSYSFRGWALEKDASSVLFTDEFEVNNLGLTEGQIVDLYAVWRYTGGGGGGGGSSSGGSSTSNKPVNTGSPSNPVTNGTWSYVSGSWYFKTNASFISTWGYILNPYAKNESERYGWFYFDASGKMLTGWQTINGKQYYLEPSSEKGTLGMCYLNTTTPDGHKVDASGARID